ncbi:hypothetical protein [Cellulomonas triticagri]|uniref:Uncharacterized protein n=1 Tax=Cellulomonas triticagri TaxID=2483352 RepID=A0A3M2JNC7_9CELL|nr:hypothetical protein [Cellulomonas triticagri]RMI13811.1 hypothetical protein EBM89_02955 [Cellulomonas triticagri]
MLLRDLPEGAVVLDDGLTGSPVDRVEWLDPDGTTVTVHLVDGTVRSAPGDAALRPADGDRLTPVDGPVPWLPATWDARAADAWAAYVAGDLDAARTAVTGAEQVEFTGDYDAWTPVESAGGGGARGAHPRRAPPRGRAPRATPTVGPRPSPPS